MPINPYEPPQDESEPPHSRPRVSVRTFFSVSLAITLLNALVASQVERGNDACLFSLFLVLFNLPVSVAVVAMSSLLLAKPADNMVELSLVIVGGGLMWGAIVTTALYVWRSFSRR